MLAGRGQADIRQLTESGDANTITFTSACDLDRVLRLASAEPSIAEAGKQQGRSE